MGKYYFYKMTVDNGGAPCVTTDLLTLAICKPEIRSTADKGDYIIGFGARSTIGERLIYIAKIDLKLHNGQYYRSSEYSDRADSIYRDIDGVLTIKPSAKYHEDGKQALHDLGTPPRYERAAVLVAEDFRYFGSKGDKIDPKIYPALSTAVYGLKQGHRVNHAPEVLKDIKLLIQNIRVQYPDKQKNIGAPTDIDCRKTCNEIEDDLEVCG